MQDNKKLSIAMTTYNGEKFLREQLDSIYNQTFKDFELIVCDDASTDGTVGILEEYRKKYGLKYFVNEKNLGYIKNFEKAISLCSGDYIALSDQDDIWLPYKLETLLKEIGSYSLIASDAKLIDEKGEVFFPSFRKKDQIIIPKEKEQFEFLLFSNFVMGCTCLFKREILQNAFPFPATLPHDWWLAIQASLLSRIKYLYRPLVLYRQHSQNTIGLRKKEKEKEKENHRNRKEKILSEIEGKIKLINQIRAKINIENNIIISMNAEKRISSLIYDLMLYKKSIQNKSFFHWHALRIAFHYRNLFYRDCGWKKYLYVLAKFFL